MKVVRVILNNIAVVCIGDQVKTPIFGKECSDSLDKDQKLINS
jgi:hypothetical protein